MYKRQANKIVAERTTLTGSIGVFGVVRNFTGTFDKVGVTTDIVKTNTFADLGDISRPMREDEKALIQRGVEQTYDLFLTRCADGRGMTKAEIDSIGTRTCMDRRTGIGKRFGRPVGRHG